MSDLIITKKNYLEYLYKWPVAAKTFVEALKSLCKISPEFTHGPRLQVEENLYEEKRLVYKSNYSYGKFVVCLKSAFFCLDDKKIYGHETLIFDLESFDIKKASQNKINSSCGVAPPWYDPEGELNDKTRETVEEYLRLRRVWTGLGAKT